jgi:hypothetical protein
MELASVRSLKEEIFEDVIAPRLRRQDVIRSLAVRATSLERSRGVQRTLAFGVAKGDNAKDYRLAVRVQQRHFDDDVRLRKALVDRAKGEIDYRYIGRVSSLGGPWHRQRQRPLLIGASVAHVRVTAGTIGGFPLHSKTGTRVLLSNNHVLANEGRATIGDPVLQPGPFDGGAPGKDQIGRLLDFVPMRTTGNLVDAAIASIDDGINFDQVSLRDIGTVNGIRSNGLQPGDRVAKVGRTTGATHGVVTAIEIDGLAIDYDTGRLSFDRQIEFEGAGADPFSEGGDSGSLIVDEAGNAAALLFAGGERGGHNDRGLTYGNPIHEVVDALGLVF